MGWFFSDNFFDSFDKMYENAVREYNLKKNKGNTDEEFIYNEVCRYTADLILKKRKLKNSPKKDIVNAQFREEVEKIEAKFPGLVAKIKAEILAREEAAREVARLNKEKAAEEQRRKAEEQRREEAERQKQREEIQRKLEQEKIDKENARINSIISKAIKSAPPSPVADIVPNPVFYLDGRGANLYVYPKFIVIDRTQGGIFNLANRTYKIIPIKYIIALQVKSTGLTTGFLEFSTFGHENTSIVGFDRVNDEDNINFASEESAIVARAIAGYLLPRII